MRSIREAVGYVNIVHPPRARDTLSREHDPTRPAWEQMGLAIARVLRYPAGVFLSGLGPALLMGLHPCAITFMALGTYFGRCYEPQEDRANKGAGPQTEAAGEEPEAPGQGREGGRQAQIAGPLSSPS